MVSPLAVSVKTDQSLYRPIAVGLADAKGAARAAATASEMSDLRLSLSVCIFYTCPLARSGAGTIETTGLRLNYGKWFTVCFTLACSAQWLPLWSDTRIVVVRPSMRVRV